MSKLKLGFATKKTFAQHNKYLNKHFGTLHKGMRSAYGARKKK